MEKYIKLLGLDSLNSFDLKELKKTYHKMVKMYHPDKAVNAEQRTEYEAKMKQLNEAYDILEKYLKNNGGQYTKSNNKNNGYKYKNNSQTEYEEQDSFAQSSEDWESFYINNGYMFNYKNESGNLSLGEEFMYEFLHKGLPVVILIVLLFLIQVQINFQVFKNPFKKEYESTVKYVGKPLHGPKSTEGVYKNPIYEPKNTDTIPENIPTYNRQSTAVNTNKYPKDDLETQKLEERYIDKLFVLVHESFANIMTEKSLTKNLTKDIQIKAEFTILNTGEIVGQPEITKSSGIYEIDQAYIDAIMMNMPYRSFPARLRKDSLKIKIGELYIL